jgi:hypothetical protein
MMLFRGKERENAVSTASGKYKLGFLEIHSKTDHHKTELLTSQVITIPGQFTAIDDCMTIVLKMEAQTHDCFL